MTPERWQQVKQILGAAIELAPGDRTAYLSGACAGDAELKAEVESLMAAHQEGGDLFESPALGDNASLVDRAAGQLIEGMRLGPYRILEQVGEGGMGSVYRGYDERDPSRRMVAIKIVKPGFDFDDILRRFRRERQILDALDHPHIARLLDAGAGDDGIPYFVMEYIEGQRIDRHCEAHGLTITQRLRLFQAVCEAVDHAHQRHIVHRDIKPSNILITGDGTPKLLDFGIGKILDPAISSRALEVTATMLRMMTPEYASPEQVRGEALTTATDIYSLGVLFYELIEGRRPYRLAGHGPHELAAAICEQEAAPLELSGFQPEAAGLARGLDAVVRKALRKNPHRRYASAAEMSRDIGRLLEGKPVSAASVTLAERAGGVLRRRRAVLLPLSAASLLALTALAAGMIWVRFSAPAQITSRPPAGITPLTTFPGGETQPCFSPDGGRIAFVWDGDDRRDDDIYIASVNGPGFERLTRDRAEEVSPAWSPDGRSIAFLRTLPQETAVFVALAGGGVQTRIADVYPTRIEAAGRHLDWSRDGKSLAVPDKSAPEQPFAIFLVEVATGRKRRITDPPQNIIGDSSPAFSPDGRKLAFLRAPAGGVADIYVMDLDRGEPPTRLTFDERSVLSLTWTQDGRAIVFASNRTGGNNLWSIGVDPRAARRGPERLPAIGGNVSEPAFSRDGRKLAFTQFFSDSNIWRLDLGPSHVARGTPRQLIVSTLDDSSPQVSPDGRKIAFRSTRSGSNEIWVCDSEGADCAQLTRFGGPLTGSPRWSPDGRFIAFDSRPQGHSDIYVAGVEGGYSRRLTLNGSEDVAPSWSADGRWIYFSSNRSGAWQIWKTPAGGGEQIQVTRRGGFAAAESPDGKFLYYAKGRSLPGLWRMPLRGGSEEPVLPALGPGRWGYWAVTRDGIYYADRAPGNSGQGIYYFNPATRRTALVLRLEKPIPIGEAALALSPDARYLLFTQVDRSGSDIMVADYGP